MQETAREVGERLADVRQRFGLVDHDEACAKRGEP